MRKLISFLLLFTLGNLLLWSKQIDQIEAKHVAENFLNNNVYIMKKNSKLEINLVYTSLNNDVKNKKGLTDKYYYVYNIGNNQGFIIISADDINYPIIGYSKTGSYDVNHLPENLKSWMKSIEMGMQQAFDNSTKPTKEIEKEWELYRNSNKGINTRITPLQPLLKTKWNQDEPYNSQIPYKVYTGCVATATAQIMKFHQHPKKGTGIIPAYQTIDPSNNVTYNIPQIDLKQYEYDWANMLDQYNNSPTPKYNNKQAKAVGLLMYHVGASAKMQYGEKGSGAFPEDALKALYTYYDYDKSIDYIVRGKYYTNVNEIIISDKEWNTIIIKELNEGRPILYSGSDVTNEGHTFVCDGYDSNGLLHFNFGWGGNQDGYYNSNAPLNYKYGQSMGINIKPNEGGEKVNRYFVNDLKISKNIVYKEECFTESHKIYDIGLNKDTINNDHMYMALYDLNGNFMTVLNEESNPLNYEENYYTISSNIPAGTYQLKVVEKKEKTYNVIRTAASVDSASVIQVLNDVKSHNFSMFNKPFLYLNKSWVNVRDMIRIQFSLINSQCKNFNGNIAIALTNNRNELKYILKIERLKLSSNGVYRVLDKNLMIPSTVRTGHYQLKIFARENNNQKWQVIEGGLINSYPITIINTLRRFANEISNEFTNDVNEFNIYPNPVDDILHIKSNTDLIVKSVTIYDFTGKEVINRTIISSNEINVSNLKSGSYVLKMNTSNGIKKYRFIKK